MKKTAIAIIVLIIATTSFAEEPRTVGVYKKHMLSDEHKKKDFDHTLHHMLYLGGVTDGLNTINSNNMAKGHAPLYCLPEDLSLTGRDAMQILEGMLFAENSSISDSMTVAEAMLVALQQKFPCL